MWSSVELDNATLECSYSPPRLSGSHPHVTIDEFFHYIHLLPSAIDTCFILVRSSSLTTHPSSEGTSFDSIKGVNPQHGYCCCLHDSSRVLQRHRYSGDMDTSLIHQSHSETDNGYLSCFMIQPKVFAKPKIKNFNATVEGF
jgi:hypothetical protein